MLRRADVIKVGWGDRRDCLRHLESSNVKYNKKRRPWTLSVLLFEMEENTNSYTNIPWVRRTWSWLGGPQGNSDIPSPREIGRPSVRGTPPTFSTTRPQTLSVSTLRGQRLFDSHRQFLLPPLESGLQRPSLVPVTPVAPLGVLCLQETDGNTAGSMYSLFETVPGDTSPETLNGTLDGVRCKRNNCSCSVSRSRSRIGVSGTKEVDVLP